MKEKFNIEVILVVVITFYKQIFYFCSYHFIQAFMGISEYGPCRIANLDRFIFCVFVLSQTMSLRPLQFTFKASCISFINL